jgi:hypothetical protein
MVKRREPKASVSRPQPTQEQIEAFASGVDGEAVKPKLELKPNAKRDFKAIRVPFNQYEYEILDKAALRSGRTKLNFIRWAILKMAEGSEK